MEYHEAVDTLEGLRRVRPKLGTETTASLLGFVGSPHEEFTAVQVAGSNGKGSTARLLDGILREHGLDVGLYTSPDLNDLRERVRVGGRKMPRDRVVEFVEEVWPFVVDRAAAGDAPTFFEVATAMAADQHVEVVLTGTATQFTRLVGTLEDGGPEQRHLAEQLTRALGFDGPGPGQGAAAVGEAKRESQPETRAHEESNYPWNRETAVMGVLDVTPDASRDGTALAAERGADMVRVHDVASNAAAIRTTQATLDGR